MHLPLVTIQIGSLSWTLLHEFASKMQLLLLFCLFLFSLALGSPSDVLYIEKLNADEAQLLDAKDFAGFVNIFTKNATYSSGGSLPNVYGADSIGARILSILGPEIITQNSINTQSIKLLPPFDEQGAAGTATGVIYTTDVNFMAGEVQVVFGKYQDKYVKTGDFSHYGGWRISERFFILIVSLSSVD